MENRDEVDAQEETEDNGTAPKDSPPTEITKKLEKKIISVIKDFSSTRAVVRQSAEMAIVKFGAKAVPQLCELLKESAPALRVYACNGLGEIADNDSAKFLVTALGDSSDKVRRAAAIALGDIKNPIAVQPLCKALTDDALAVRRESSWALYKLRDSAAVVPLCSLLNDENKYLKMRIATVLGEFKSEAAVEPLIKALSGDAEVRTEVVKALQKIGSPRALEAISGIH